MKCIIISGIPASGKTTIATTLSKELGVPILTKDFFKEQLFETDGRSNIIHSTWYEKEAKRLFLEAIHEQVQKDKDLIIESNFEPRKDRSIFMEVLKNQECREVYCTAKGWKIFKRFVARNESGHSNKHPSHHDRMWYMQMLFICTLKTFGIHYPHSAMDITDERKIIDTTDFSKINMKEIIEFTK